MMEDELKLISEAIVGNENSFELLLKPYIKNARQTAYLLLHDYNLAEDAVQEALIQTHISLSNYESERSLFKTWFNKVVINCSLKIARKKSFWSKLDNDLLNRETPEKKSLLDEESELIFDCVKKLSLKLKTVIILHYFQDLTIEEMSKTLSVSKGTVKSRLHNARKKLKRIMNENKVELHTWGGKETWSKN